MPPKWVFLGDIPLIVGKVSILSFVKMLRIQCLTILCCTINKQQMENMNAAHWLVCRLCYLRTRLRLMRHAGACWSLEHAKKHTSRSSRAGHQKHEDQQLTYTYSRSTAMLLFFTFLVTPFSWELNSWRCGIQGILIVFNNRREKQRSLEITSARHK